MHVPSSAAKTSPVETEHKALANRQAFSPMDLSDTFSIPDEDAVPFEALHPLLQGFVDEHVRIVEELDRFERVLADIQEHGVGEESNRGLGRFFRFFDEHVVPHNRREERQLFNELRECLITSGAHSRMEPVTTSVDVLETDHAQVLQIAAVSLNLFGLGGRLADLTSRAITVDAAVQQGLALVEQLRMHILREDNIVFPLVQRLMSSDDLDMHYAPWKKETK